MHRIPLVLTLVLCLLAAAGGQARAATQHSGWRSFHSPTKNIGCTLETPTRLRCDIGVQHWQNVPKRPAWCHFDWPGGVRMAALRRARLSCISDSVLRMGPLLEYGHTWRNGRFRCTMRRTGLTCRTGSLHGFFLSRERRRLW